MFFLYRAWERARTLARGKSPFTPTMKHRCLSAAAALVSFAAPALFAQTVPKITAISPEWIQRGTTREIVVTGENLGGVTEILFNGDTGLTASNATTPAVPVKSSVQIESTGGGIARVEAAPKRDEKKLLLRVTAGPEASLSARELRVLAPGGVSNPVNLNVGQWPEINRRDGNTSLADAQPIELPAVLSGAISAAAQTNVYRFKASKGQELVFEVDAARRGSPLDSSLMVLDLEGKELARNEDALGLDSLLFFTAPADGEFLVALRDFRYRGGGEYSYRLTAGSVPYLESYFPFGAQRGKSVDVGLQGYNLDGTTKMSLSIEAKAPRRQEIRVRTPRGYSNLVPFDVSDLPEVDESEPNNTLTNAQTLTLPTVVNGRVGAAKDVDQFRFKSAADQKLVCEVAAARFGSKLDALLVLSDAKGAVLQRNDDAAGTDARIEFDAKKETEYVVALRDLTDRGGERFGYRLSIRPPSGGVGAGFVARFLPDTPRVHREGITRVRCEVTRNGGFDGPVRFTCEGLPAGVYAESVALPNAPHSGLMLLSATKDAPLGSFPLRVMASGQLGGKWVTLPCEPLSGDRPARQGYLTVLETVPFALELTTLDANLEQNQAGNVDVLVYRRDGFSGDIKLVAEGFNAGREGLNKSFNGGDTVIKGADSTGRLTLTPRMDSEIGTRTIVVRGESTVDGRQVVTYTRPLPISVTQYPLVLSSTLPRLALTVLPPGTDSAAGEAETKIRVERRAGFAGDVDLTLEGLPDGLKSDVPKIPAGIGEVTVKLTVTEKAALGTNFNFTVVGTALVNDRRYKTRTSPIALSVTAPEAIEVATNAVAAPAPPPPSATK